MTKIAEQAAWASHDIVCYGGPLRRAFMARILNGLSWAEAYDDAAFSELMAAADAADAEQTQLRKEAVAHLQVCPVARLRKWVAGIDPEGGGGETCAGRARRMRSVWRRWYATRSAAAPATPEVRVRLADVIADAEKGYVRSVRRPSLVGPIYGVDGSSTPAGTSSVVFRSYCVRRDGQIYLVVLCDGHTGSTIHQMDVERVEVWTPECIVESNLTTWIEENAIDL